MAGTIQNISRMNLGRLCSGITRQTVGSAYLVNRKIFTADSIGMDDYINSRNRYIDRYKTGVSTFLNKMVSHSAESKELTFTEDLKAVLHLVGKEPEHIELIKNMVKKYHSQDNELRFGNFKFGPVIMRAFHYLNEPDAALQLYRDPELESFFHQMTSFIILLDLLFENGHYKDVREVYIATKEKCFAHHPKSPAMVVFAACYKENTPESLKFAVSICKELTERGHIPLRKMVALTAALALKQNSPHIALEILQLSQRNEYISIRSIRMMAFADLDRIEDLVINFRLTLNGDRQRGQYLPEVEKRSLAMMERMNLDSNSEIGQILAMLKRQSYFSDTSIEEQLLKPFEHRKPMNQQDNTDRNPDRSWSNSHRSMLQNNS